MYNYPRIINLSLPKTGSNSVSKLFTGFGGTHEAEFIKSTNFIMENIKDFTKKEIVNDFILNRQNSINSRVDSATFLHFIQDYLVDIWPDSVYLHILRRPDEWVISYLNMLCNFIISLKKNPNIYIIDWSNKYAKYQFSELELQSLINVIENKDMLILLLDSFYSYWLDRSYKTNIIVRKCCSSISVKLTDLDQLGPYLARAAAVPLFKLPKVNHYNSGMKGNFRYELICDSIKSLSPSLNSFNQANDFYLDFKRNINLNCKEVIPDE